MLISQQNKLIFIHIQKTGGNTISRLLRENISDIYSFQAKHGFAGNGMRELKDWEKYFKFAFVRNPWDRLVSWYSMIKGAEDISWLKALVNERKKKHYKQIRYNKIWRYVLDNSSSFEEFIVKCTDPNEINKCAFNPFIYNQLDYVTDKDGKLIVDFIGKFESYENDLHLIFGKIGVKLQFVPHENLSLRLPYSTYYTLETEMIVRERFKKDIEFFGYLFRDSN
ncbi:MAG: sulfotransferase family 2 domain-containing protein [Candidatus Anammoxibacter sp.]